MGRERACQFSSHRCCPLLTLRNRRMSSCVAQTDRHSLLRCKTEVFRNRSCRHSHPSCRRARWRARRCPGAPSPARLPPTPAPPARWHMRSPPHQRLTTHGRGNGTRQAEPLPGTRKCCTLMCSGCLQGSICGAVILRRCQAKSGANLRKRHAVRSLADDPPERRHDNPS